MKKSTRAALSFFVIFLLLLGAGTGFYTAWAQMQAVTHERAESTLMNSAQYQMGLFSEALSGRLYLLDVMAGKILEDAEGDSGGIAAEIKKIQADREFPFRQIAIYSRDGSCLYSDCAELGDIFKQDFFPRVLEGERTIVNNSGDGHLVFAVPLYGDGGVDGVVAARCQEKDLRRFLINRTYEQEGFSILVDSTGTLVVNAETEGDVLSVPSFFDVVDGGTLYLEDTGISPERVQAHMAQQESLILGYEHAGVAYVAALVPLTGSMLPDCGWYLLNAIPRQQLVETTMKDYRSVLSAMGTFVVCGIIALGIYLVLLRDEQTKEQQKARELHRSAEQLRIVVGQSGKEIYRYDVAADTVFCGAQRYSRRQWLHSGVVGGVVTAECVAEYGALFDGICNGKPTAQGVFRVRTPEGRYRWYRHDATTVFDSQKKPVEAVISYCDYTEQREREIAYLKWSQELRNLLDANATVMEWNLTRDVCDKYQCGDQVVRRTDGKLDECIVGYVSRMVHKNERSHFSAVLTRERLIGLYASGISQDAVEYRELGDKEDYRWMRVQVQLAPYPESDDIKAYFVFISIDTQKREELARLAYSQQDSLTGLLNRAAFVSRVEHALDEYQNGITALMMVDIDGFKAVNDSLGHDVGDEVLADCAVTMTAQLRGTDLVGRIGGDEFMIALPDIPYEEVAQRKAEQISAAIRRVVQETVPISASIGIACYPEDGKTYAELYKKADQALYRTKEGGKDGFSFFRGQRTGMEMAADWLGQAAVADGDSQWVESRHLILLTRREQDCSLVQGVCGASGPTVVVTEDSRQAAATLYRLRSSNAMVLLDLDLPEGQAFDFLEKQRDNPEVASIPTVALVDEQDRALVKHAMELGANDYFVRPVSPEELVTRIGSVFARRRGELRRFQNCYARNRWLEDERYRQLLRATDTAVVTLDWSSNAFRYSPQIGDVLYGTYNDRPLWAILLADMVGRTVDIKAMQELVFHLVEDGGRQRAERITRLRNRQGEWRWFRFQVVLMTTEHERDNKVMLVFNDVTESVETTNELRRRAERDPLTGLYNRTAFCEQVGELVAASSPGHYTMLCLDINNFKVINDRCGALVGDETLRHIAEILEAHFAPYGGICCRSSADHFAVLYPTDTVDDTVLSQMCREAAAPSALAQAISLSMGRYRVWDTSLTAGAIYDRATIAQDSIKGLYGQQLADYTETMRARILEEQLFLDSAAAALEEGQFEPWIQPQYNQANGLLVGAEVLVRWRHPDLGLIPPGRFIPVFERTGFIYDMDRSIWEQACALLQRWKGEGRPPLALSVNVSRSDVLHPDFYRDLTALTQQYQVPPALLRLEITESAFVEMPDALIAMMERLKAYGFVIEIDDFGSGYSSLNTLKDVPADILKLDMRFLEGGRNSARGGIILEAIVRMAKWVGMPVIAEGVETRAQADYLQSIGCAYAQGYLYGAPMPVEDYELLLDSSRTEQKMTTMEAIETLDSYAFWDPVSLETLFFNSYVGGAFVIEYRSDKVELLRVNRKYAQLLGGPDMTVQQAIQTKLSEHTTQEGRNHFHESIRQAIEEGGEVVFEVELFNLPGGRERIWVRVVARQLARSGSCSLIYCAAEDISAQKQTELALQESAHQLDFLNETSKRLLTQIDTDEAVCSVLQKTCDYFDADSAYICEFCNFEDNGCTAYAAGKCGGRCDRCCPFTEQDDRTHFWQETFRQCRHVAVAAKPPEECTSRERHILGLHRVNSFAAVPLWRDGEVIGIMGVDNPRQKLEYVGQLEALGDYMSAVLTRRNLTR